MIKEYFPELYLFQAKIKVACHPLPTYFKDFTPQSKNVASLFKKVDLADTTKGKILKTTLQSKQDLKIVFSNRRPGPIGVMYCKCRRRVSGIL